MKSSAFQTLEKQDAWAVHVQEILHTLDIPSGMLSDNVAASVATYCRQFHPQGVQRSDLVLLIARAFCAVSERNTAEQILSSMPSHRRHCSRWLEILSELHHFPAMLPYFSQAVIRPADWAGAQQDRMWVLDVSRLKLSEAEKHEMMLYRSLRSILEHMFVFWDATSGEGVLGLKGIATLTLDTKVSGGKSARDSDQMMLDFISDLFLRQKKLQDWQSVPSLLTLDG